MAQEKRIWSLDTFVGARCAMELHVNDVPLFPMSAHWGGGPMRSPRPVSHMLRTGINKIAIYAWWIEAEPHKPTEDTICKLDLVSYIKDEGDPFDAEPYFSLHFDYSAIDEPKRSPLSGTTSAGPINFPIPGNARVISSSIKDGSDENYWDWKIDIIVDLPLQYGPLPWESGDIIDNNAATFASLLSEYEKVHQILKSKDVEAFRKYVSGPRDYIYDRLYETADSAWEASNLQDIIPGKRPEYALQNLPLENELLIFGEGRLATLVDANSYRSPLFYRWEEYQRRTNVTLIFMLKNGRWIPIL